MALTSAFNRRRNTGRNTARRGVVAAMMQEVVAPHTINYEEVADMSSDLVAGWGGMLEFAENMQAAHEALGELMQSIWQPEPEPVAAVPDEAPALPPPPPVVISIETGRDIRPLRQLRLRKFNFN